MNWLFLRAARVAAERQAIAALQDEKGWLSETAYRLEAGLHLKVDFSIAHDGETFDLTLAYPDHFPDVPPLITSRDGKLLSGHQYGPTGELCLEYRADNWEPHITGAMMIESAHRLLAGERVEGKQAEVPTAHRQSQGQELRGLRYRFLSMPGLRSKLGVEPVGAVHKAVVREHRTGDTYVAWISEYGEGAETWRDPGVSTRPVAVPGIVVRLQTLSGLPDYAKATDLEALLNGQDLAELWQRLMSDTAVCAVALCDGATTRFFWISGVGERHLFPYRTVSISDDSARQPEAFAALAGKSVGIVGAGSLGSKIAVSLARAGVGGARVFDDDLSLPHNMVRNDLDWRSVGQHKVDGVQDRILEAAPACVVEVRRLALGGQESAAGTASAVEQLGQCDLIIDATADPRAFNFCAAAAVAQNKPMLWAEVFAGGIGGMMARAVPERDPPPLAARRQIHAWCERQGVVWEGTPIDYGVQHGNGPPLIASDADVGVIAGHATHFALDTLLRSGSSAYPASVYLMGLSASWLFRGPFDTVPITLSHETWAVSTPDDQEAIQGVIEFLTRILPPRPADETDTAA